MIDLEAPACRANVLDSPSEDSLAYQTLMLENMGRQMNVRTLMISIFLGSAFFRAAEAHFLTGNDLLKNCTSPDKDTAAFCTGIIVGYYEMLTFLQYDCGDDSKKTAGQIEDVVVKYLKEHPSDRSKPAASVSTIAISEGFKCLSRDEASFSDRWPKSNPQQ